MPSAPTRGWSSWKTLPPHLVDILCGRRLAEVAGGHHVMLKIQVKVKGSPAEQTSPSGPIFALCYLSAGSIFRNFWGLDSGARGRVGGSPRLTTHGLGADPLPRCSEANPYRYIDQQPQSEDGTPTNSRL